MVLVAMGLPSRAAARYPVLASAIMAGASQQLRNMASTGGNFLQRTRCHYADIHDIKVIFVDEPDDSNPLGIKGLGEIGIVGVAAAIANAVYHATGKRVRDLPIMLDKLRL